MVVVEEELVLEEEGLVVVVAVWVVVAAVVVALEAVAVFLLGSGNYSYNPNHTLQHQVDEGSFSSLVSSCNVYHHRRLRSRTELGLPHLNQFHGASLPFHPPKAGRTALH